jgi:hypothetical protein
MSAVSSTFGAYQPLHSEDHLAIVGFSYSSNSSRSRRHRLAQGANWNASGCCRPPSRHNFFLRRKLSFRATAAADSSSASEPVPSGVDATVADRESPLVKSSMSSSRGDAAAS